MNLQNLVPRMVCPSLELIGINHENKFHVYYGGWLVGIGEYTSSQSMTLHLLSELTSQWCVRKVKEAVEHYTNLYVTINKTESLDNFFS